MFDYNDMNTNVPNPFVTQSNVVLSGAGAGRKEHNHIENLRMKWMVLDGWTILKRIQ